MLQNFLILKPVSKTVSAPSLLGRKKKKKHSRKNTSLCLIKTEEKKIEKRENKRKREEKNIEEIQKLFLQYFWL